MELRLVKGSYIKKSGSDSLHICLILFPILAPYKIGTMFSSYGYLMLILLFFHSIIINRTLFFYKPLIIFFILSSSFYIFNSARFSQLSIVTFNNIFMPIIQICLLAMFTSRLNFNKLYYYYRITGIIAMTIIFIHSIKLYIYNIPAVPIALLPVGEDSFVYWDYFRGIRPSGVFSEPQAYATFMLPLLIFAFYKKNNLFAFLISISIFLSTSSLGIAAVILSYFYMLSRREVSITFKVIVLISISILFFSFYNLEIFSYAKHKIAMTSLENNIRLTRGFLIYLTFDFMDLFFGIGDSLQKYVTINIHQDWTNNYFESGVEHLLGYVTTIAGTFVRYGFICGIFLWHVFYKCFKISTGRSTRGLILLIIILSFAQTLLFNSSFVFFYALLLGLSDKEDLENGDFIHFKTGQV